ncbi:MAG TPA: BtrH N-terminal domain-containing protein, partial [Anaerolineales bacterium]|nr:BtrH N-terminal domain-containing protein [Anaerolineales bacterium]
MTLLKDYKEFSGLHWETGTVRNFFAYRGYTAPHSDRPYTEAMLMGISGGAVMGYFSFAYEGYDPHVSLLTRNTFDPWDTMLQRLGVAQTVLQTNSSEKGLFNLIDTLESGIPAIVWADLFTLPY